MERDRIENRLLDGERSVCLDHDVIRLGYYHCNQSIVRLGAYADKFCEERQLRAGSRALVGSSRRDATARAVPEFTVSLFLVLLMWLFAELIFLPLSAESLTKELSGRVTPIVAAAFILAIGYLLPQTVRKGEAAVKTLSEALAKRYAKGRHEKMRRVFESVGSALLSAILGIIVSSLLYWIHPVFGGMAILVTVIVAFIFVLQGASQASDEILGRVGH